MEAVKLGMAAAMEEEREAQMGARDAELAERRRWKADQKLLLDEMLPKATGRYSPADSSCSPQQTAGIAPTHSVQSSLQILSPSQIAVHQSVQKLRHGRAHQYGIVLKFREAQIEKRIARREEAKARDASPDIQRLPGGGDIFGGDDSFAAAKAR